MAQVPKIKGLSYINTHLIGIERLDKVNQEDPQESREDNGSQNNFLARNKGNKRKIPM
jgi:hypothetical protein